MGNLDMLKRAKEERRPRLIDNALHAVEQARKLTGRLLAFSRRQTLFPEPVDLKGMITGMDDMLTQSLRGDIRLDLDLPEGVWPVEVDPTELQIALINIAVNARDAMPKGGAFRVKIENTVLRYGEMREAVAISMSDTGVGIPPEALTAGVRAVLHHEGSGAWHGSRARPGVWLCPAVGRHRGHSQ